MNRKKYLKKRNKLINKIEKMSEKGYIRNVEYRYDAYNHIYAIVIKLPEGI